MMYKYIAVQFVPVWCARACENCAVCIIVIIGYGNRNKFFLSSYGTAEKICMEIIPILDSTGDVVVEYTYDAWGNHIVTPTDEAYSELSQLNPFRYRGYYYDTETGLYFLKTRYYDPEVGRFITIDDLSYLDPESINGLNLYAYCGDNPVMAVDPNGASWSSFWSSLGNWFKDNWAKVVSGIAIVAGVVTMFIPGAQVVSGLLLSAGVSSLIGGYANEAAGGSFLGGWIGGLISGIMSAIPGLNIIGGMVGGMLGNIATGLIDKYAYGRNISGIEFMFSTVISGLAGAMFKVASIPFAFDISPSDIWYNAAIIGWTAYSGGINAFRTWLSTFVLGKVDF